MAIKGLNLLKDSAAEYGRPSAVLGPWSPPGILSGWESCWDTPLIPLCLFLRVQSYCSGLDHISVFRSLALPSVSWALPLFTLEEQSWRVGLTLFVLVPAPPTVSSLKLCSKDPAKSPPSSLPASLSSSLVMLFSMLWGFQMLAVGQVLAEIILDSFCLESLGVWWW